MAKRTSYLKVIMEITDKASKTYTKYHDYKKAPEQFKEKEPNLYITFQVADNILRTAKDYIKGSKKSIMDTPTLNTIEKCYEILESSEIDSNDKIKANYKRLVKEYHPDIISGKDLPKGFIEFANIRFKEIHGAYEILKKERRF
jgi:DnaJ-domain-containing protein 1